MKPRIHLPKLVRILMIIALVIPLAMSGVSPARASSVTILAGVPGDSDSPTALPGGPYIVLAGQPVTLSGAGSDPLGESLTFAWDLDFDETFETAGDTAVFTNTAGQSREVPIGFRACNTSGLCGTAQTFVRVRNIGQIWVSGPEPSQDIWMPNDEIGIPDGPIPAMLEGFGQVIDVVGGAGFVAALRADGTVWTMGDNFYGQLGDPSLPTGWLPDGHRAHSSVPVQAGISDVVAIASKGGYVMALKRDGTVWTWGSNEYLTLGNGIADGNPHPTPTQVENLSGVVAIAASNMSSFALTNKGEIYGWGLGDQIFGRSCDTPFPCKITTIQQTIALQVTPTWAIVLKQDGTVWFWGGYNPETMEDRLDPEQIQGLNGITAISASGSGIHSTLLALKNDGTVWGFGNNANGQLGQDPLIPYPPYLRDYIGPVQIPGLAGIRAIAAGDALQAALLQDGTVAGWGLVVLSCPGGCGEYWLPSPLAGLANVQAVAVGDDFRLAIVPGSVPDTPDLAITQIADHEMVSTGDPVGFTITINNNGNGVANSVTLTDTLPTAAELSWSVGGTDAASCTITAGVVSCNFGDMPPGVVKTIRLTSPTQYIYGKGFCPTISSTATVIAANQPEDSSATASTQVLCPSIYIELLADNQDSQNIPAGDPVSFTVKFGNAGEGIARDVIAETVLPTNPGLSWSISSITPSEAANNCVYGTDYNGTYELICSFDQMDPQQEVTITLTSPTTADSCGMINSVGYISISNGIWYRHTMKPPIVTCPPIDLAITQTADHEMVSTGDPVGFTITITNNGVGAASSVTLTDTLPTYSELNWSVSGTDAAACTITAGVVSCNFGDIAPGAVKTIRLTSPTQYIRGTTGFCPTIGSTATVMASNQPEDSNATASTQVLCPHVYLTVGSNTQSVTAGDPISYIIIVGNEGEGIARDVASQAELPNNAGLNWSITNVTPASAAGNCTLDTSGTYRLLSCLLDELAAGQEVAITVSSPTTSDSCGTLSSGGGAFPSNGLGVKAKYADIIVSCTVGETVQPGEAATLTLPDGRGQIEFPAGLVSVPTTFTYTEQETPSQALGSYTFAGLSFTLVATDSDGNPVTSFPASYTIRLTYQDSDWQSAGIADEGLLNLTYWDTATNQWVNVLPCEGCSLDTGQNHLMASLNHLTEFALLASTDTTPPATSASVSPEASASGWNMGPVTVTLTASDSESGVHNTEYNLNGAGWTTYSAPFDVSTESMSHTVHNTVQYRSTDNAGNVEETRSLAIQLDMTAPTVSASAPLSGNAVQGGIKFGVNLADALSGPASAMLSIREADGASGKEIGYDNLATVFNSISGNWELAQPFDTTQLPDGFYVLVATGKDVAGNEKTEIIPFSVRNWAVLELLPSTESNKAGRTMPVKFSLRVVQEVDPAQPFVYSEELTITIYETGQPTPVLQSTTFGLNARDYRINAAQETYITNFQTLKKPMQYTVEILRDALSIGTFGFQTTK